jgi:hypothetical protein
MQPARIIRWTSQRPVSNPKEIFHAPQPGNFRPMRSSGGAVRRRNGWRCELFQLAQNSALRASRHRDIRQFRHCSAQSMLETALHFFEMKPERTEFSNSPFLKCLATGNHF